ncbi:MAG: hypothetical protein ACXVFN_14790 [Solirubrobacteraceae bacterium]
MSGDASFDLDAAGLRADGSGLSTDVEVLAAKLEDALPRHTTVERRGRGLLARKKVVRRIEVRLGVRTYALEVRDAGVDAACEQEVRGVVIKREQLELADWLERLTADLREQARDSADARAALDRLLG